MTQRRKCRRWSRIKFILIISQLLAKAFEKTDMHFYPLDPLDNHMSPWEKSPQDRLAFLLDSEFGDRTEAWDLRSCSVSHRQILWIPTQWSWHASRMGWVWWPNVARWNESDETITFGWKLGTPPSCSRPSVLPYQWNIWSQEFLWKLRNGCFLFAGVIGRLWPFGANGDHFGRFHLLCYRLSNSTVRKWGFSKYYKLSSMLWNCLRSNW